MARPELIEQERQTLSAFRKANLLRPKIEADAEARRKNELGSAEGSLQQTVQSADELLNRANLYFKDVHGTLATGKVEYLLEQTKSSPPSINIASEPNKELAQSVSTTADAATKLIDSVNSLLRWREQVRARRRFLLAATAIAFVILAIAGFFALQAWQRALASERIYVPALAALETGEWDKAQTGFEQLNSEDKNYGDTQQSLRESYYRPASAALQANQWDTARTQLQHLLQIDSNYKDAQILLRESYYRPASEYLKAKQWKQARIELESLLKVDSDYQDAQTMIKESFYGAGVDDLNAGDKTMAQMEFMNLLTQYGDYRDVTSLLTKNVQPRQLTVTKIDSPYCDVRVFSSNPPPLAIDGNIDTFANCHLQPESINLSLTSPALVTLLRIYSPDWSPVRAVNVLFSDGSRQLVQGAKSGWQKIDLTPNLGTSVGITIAESTPGQDVWWHIGEIELWGYQ